MEGKENLQKLAMDTQNELVCRKIRFFSPERKEIRRLYRSSFPKAEKLPFWLLRLIACRPSAHFLGFFDQRGFVGFAYLFDYRKTTFLFYLATEPSLRDQGYGSKILQKLKDQNQGRCLLLNIEPLDATASNAKQRERRLAFYLRNGFAESGYCCVDETGRYDTLVTGAPFDPKEYEKLLDKLALYFVPQKVEKK